MKKEIKQQTIRRLFRYLLEKKKIWAIPTSAIAAGQLTLSTHASNDGTVK